MEEDLIAQGNADNATYLELSARLTGMGLAEALALVESLGCYPAVLHQGRHQALPAYFDKRRAVLVCDDADVVVTASFG